MRFIHTALAVLVVLGSSLPASVRGAPPNPPPVEEVDTNTSGSSGLGADEEGADGEDTEASDEVDGEQQIRPFSVRRGSVQVLTGLGMMVGGTLAGGLAGFFVGAVGSGPTNNAAGIGIGVGAAVGYLVGTPAGVWLGGNAMYGNGSIWATAAGTAVGVLAGGATTLVISRETGGNGGAAFWMTALPITGGIVGYELTSGPDPGRAEKGLTLQVGASPPVSGRGTLLSIMGRW